VPLGRDTPHFTQRLALSQEKMLCFLDCCWIAESAVHSLLIQKLLNFTGSTAEMSSPAR
jgi:hypothetical protein